MEAEEANNKRIWTIKGNKYRDVDDKTNNNPHHSHNHHDYGVDKRMIHDLLNNYYTNASLMANSYKSATFLGFYNSCTVRAAYNYGKHVGIEFQLVDDVLHFDVDGKYGGGDNNNDGSGARKKTGKGSLTDLRLGLVTAPVL